jgi:hypothetical protein
MGMLSSAETISMTDTFAHGPDTPLGAFAAASQSESDVTGTLAELERKLHELERELTSIGQGRTPHAEPNPIGQGRTSHAEPNPLYDERHLSSSTGGLGNHSRAGGRLVDEVAESANVAESVFAADAEPRARPSDAWLAGLAELRMFRDRLERFAHELTDDYEALLARVMSGVASSTQRPAEAEPYVPSRQAGTEAASPPRPLEPPPRPPDSPTYHEDRVLFEGRVELGAGPFYDIDSLSVFERLLASLPHATDVAVRRFEASHAVVDLRLEAPIALVGELRRVLETDFSVRQITAGRLALTFDDV